MATVKKPPTLLYGTDEPPPIGVTVLTGVQHAGVNAIFLLFPLLGAREGGLGAREIGDVLSLAMLVQAAITVLQAYPVGPLGARLFCPMIYSAIYLGPSLAAVKAGGLPLVFGMTIVAGVVQIALARLLPYLRPIFPPEVAGLIILLIGVTNGTIGVRNLLGIGTASGVGAIDLAIGFTSLALMIVLNIWTKGMTRVFCGLIGIAFGYLTSLALGRVGGTEGTAFADTPLVNLPGFAHLGWSFDAALAVAFVVAAVAASTKTMGSVTSYQKLNDANWVRPNMRSVSGGVLAEGLGTTLSGLFGSIGLNASASSLGLAGATGVASRPVALAIGAIFAILAFVPKVAMVVAVMPRSVIGAALVFTAAFVLINGIEVITSRMLDARRALVIGLALIGAVSVDVFPAFFAGLPPGVRPFFNNALAFGTLVALGLNAVFRLGTRRVERLTIDPARVDSDGLHDFLGTRGAAWGARRDVIERASFNLAQSIETVVDSCAPEGPMQVEASFDEFNLDVRISYTGPALELPTTRPTNAEIIASPEGERKLAGFMLRRHADGVTATHRGGRSTLHFHFAH
jgi:NCS2 family nucleobase:cation symporter-2